MRHWYSLIVGVYLTVVMLSVVHSAPLARSGNFDSAVPTPEAVLGFALGERPVRYAEVVNYFEQVAKASKRMQLRDYGKSGAGRRLLQLTLTSANNRAREADMQAAKTRLANTEVSGTEASALISTLPLTAWMGYGIHGNEISGCDAAVELVYRLAAGQDPAIIALLDALVIHIDPMFNPDGRERFLAHTSAFSRRMPYSDVQDLAHEGAWPYGRGNHYFFDLNRDALYTVQDDARARVTAILAAEPQLLVDAHEMEAEHTFLFALPNEPHNPHLPPYVHQSWRDFAVDHAAAFDREGISYYSRAWDEVFYPGYFDVWPAYLGAVPILYEQGTTYGSTIELPNERLRSYAQAVDNQLVSSLANLATAARQRSELLTRWWQARSRAANSTDHRARVWLVSPENQYKLKRIQQILHTQGLRYARLTESTRATGLYSLWNGKETISQDLPVGTLAISSAQSLGGLVRNLFDFHVPMSESFLRLERERLDLGGNTLVYDTTAWTVPLAFAADVVWSSSRPRGVWQEAIATETAVRESIQPAPKSIYGYLYRDPGLYATTRLLQAGVKMRVARDAFSVHQRDYPAGTFLIRQDDQAQDIQPLLNQEQQQHAVQFTAVDTALAAQGPDLGDERFQLLQASKVGLLTGPGFDVHNSGAIWHLFDQRLTMPLTLLNFTELPQLDLNKYDVLILGDVSEDSVTAQLFTKDYLQPLLDWVRSGGTLVSLRNATQQLTQKGITATQSRGEVLEKYPPVMLGRTAEEFVTLNFSRAAGAAAAAKSSLPAAQRYVPPVLGEAAQLFLRADAGPIYQLPTQSPSLEEWSEKAAGHEGLKARAGELLRKYLPRGAYLKVQLKPQHWLAFEVGEKIPALFREADALIADGEVEAVGRYDNVKDLAIAGLIWPEAVGYIADTAYVVRESLGQGQIILFANDPVFRGYSLGTERLFLNAVILGPAFN
jgi:hypothetical protein